MRSREHFSSSQGSFREHFELRSSTEKCISQVIQSRYRILLVASHPVQYSAPVFRQMAQHPQCDILVAYCTLHGSEFSLDPEFGVAFKWDVPLLDGYKWTHIPNLARNPGSGRFWGLLNFGMWRLLRDGNFDAVVLYTGYVCATFWITMAAAKAAKVAILFGADASRLDARDGQSWKLRLKAWLWPRLFRLADVVIVPSSQAAVLMRSLGIPTNRVALTPYVVDNDWWVCQADRVNRRTVRTVWNIPSFASVVLFCAKLQPWKRPIDLLQAFAQANIPDAYLVFAGDGPLRGEIGKMAHVLGIADKVRILGFVNQSKLPETYCASDLLVLPSDYDHFAVVVNEAMLCGCAVAASDKVGARYDLIEDGKTGFIFPSGDIDAIARTMKTALGHRAKLDEIRLSAFNQMKNWSPRENVNALVQAIKYALTNSRAERNLSSNVLRRSTLDR